MVGGNTEPQDSDTGQVSPLRAEAERLLVEAEWRVRRAHRYVYFWSIIDITLGFPAAVLAAMSGAVGLASAQARVPAALLALVAAGFSAGAGFLRSDVRRTAHRRSRRAWAEVEANARLLLLQEPSLPDGDSAHRALQALFDSRTAAHGNDVVQE